MIILSCLTNLCLSSCFAELSKLKLVRLDFSYNKVSVIPPAYRLITSLSVLELAHNPLTSPPAQVCDIRIFFNSNVQWDAYPGESGVGSSGAWLGWKYM